MTHHVPLQMNDTCFTLWWDAHTVGIDRYSFCLGKILVVVVEGQRDIHHIRASDEWLIDPTVNVPSLLFDTAFLIQLSSSGNAQRPPRSRGSTEKSQGQCSRTVLGGLAVIWMQQ